MNIMAKFDEAVFFLSKMEENQYDPDQRYYLSAFLSAARSVLQWIVKEELAKWEDLYKYDDAVIKFFKKKRNFNIHHGPVIPEFVRLQKKEYLHLSDAVYLRDGGQQKKLAPVTAGPRQASTSSIKRNIYFDVPTDLADDNGEVLGLCRRYLKCLKDILNDLKIST